MSKIGREKIATMIPHDGAMILLDEVLDWNDVAITCLSRRYAAADNPLRQADGAIGAACGIEIAAQAMAVHARLTAADDARPTQGYLASLREIRLSTPYLDTNAGPLTIEATRLMGDSSGATYEFSLHRDGITVLSGRATVLLEQKP